MRIASDIQSQQTLLNLQTIYAGVAKLQNQISSGNRISAPSDDPLGTVQILQDNTANLQFTTNLGAINGATNTLQASVNALTSVQNILNQVRSTGQTAASTGVEAGATAAFASQINAAINQLLSVANTQQADGSYLFSGAASGTTPFAITSSNASGQAAAVTYQGSQQTSDVIVAPGQTVSTLIPGSGIFQPNLGGPTTYTGNTGVKPGTTPDTETGQGTLQVVHTSTTYAAGSGVSAGASSFTTDTILGPSGANNLQITVSADGLSGTVSLNGGSTVAFTNQNSDLIVTGPNGEKVSLDTTGVTAGFNGTVAIQADGTLSTDGGATTTPINFVSNQAISNGTTGAITYVDTTNVRQAGNAQATYPGQTDLFQTLIQLRDTINNTQNLSTADRQAALNQQLGVLDRIGTAVATPLGDQATKAQFLSSLKSRTTTQQNEVQKATSSVQSTDMASAIIALQQQQNLYQASLEVISKLNGLSLANFIQ